MTIAIAAKVVLLDYYYDYYTYQAYRIPQLTDNTKMFEKSILQGWTTPFFWKGT